MVALHGAMGVGAVDDIWWWRYRVLWVVAVWVLYGGSVIQCYGCWHCGCYMVVVLYGAIGCCGWWRYGCYMMVALHGAMGVGTVGDIWWWRYRVLWVVVVWVLYGGSVIRCYGCWRCG